MHKSHSRLEILIIGLVHHKPSHHLFREEYGSLGFVNYVILMTLLQTLNVV